MLSSPQFVAALARIRSSTRPSPRFRFVPVGRRWFRVVPVFPWWRVWLVPLVGAALALALVVFAVFVLLVWGAG